MTHKTREVGPDAAAHSNEEQIERALARGLGRLREARPGFQDALEARLMARLSEPARHWWRRNSVSDRPRRSAPGILRMPRRKVLGLAAASAVALAAASLALPLVGTPEVSAREILEKAQASYENPVMAGVKSFHLTAKMWTSGGPKGASLNGNSGGPRDLTTEQWFVAPDKMRSETRSQDSSGKPVVSGMVMSGGEAKQYSTDGANDVFTIGMFAAPVGAKGAAFTVDERREVRNGTPQAAGAPASVAATPVAVSSGGVPVERRGGTSYVIAYETKDGSGKDGERSGDRQVIRIGEGCPEPKRTGEGIVAGRSVFVIENDLRGCLPANAPDKIPARHVNWVDQKTFLPLKMEAYDRNGVLVDRYEATSIAYDVDIPQSTFTDLPAGTSVRPFKVMTFGPGEPGTSPGQNPSTR